MSGGGRVGGGFGWVQGLVLAARNHLLDLLAAEATAHLDLFCTANTHASCMNTSLHVSGSTTVNRSGHSSFFAMYV